MALPLLDSLSQDIAVANFVEAEENRLATVASVAEEQTENMKGVVY